MKGNSNEKAGAAKAAGAVKKELASAEQVEALNDLYRVMKVKDGIPQPSKASKDKVEAELKDLAKELEPEDIIQAETRATLTKMGLLKAAKKVAAPVKAGKAVKAKPEAEESGEDEGPGVEEPPKAKASKKSHSHLDDKMKITIVKDKEPKREGTKAFARFKAYRAAKTVGGYVQNGGKRSDISFDIYHGRLTVG